MSPLSEGAGNVRELSAFRMRKLTALTITVNLG